jgi:hypothetical protein
MIEDIVTLLASENVGTAGEDLLIGELPLDKKEAIAAMYAVSPVPHMTFDVYEQVVDFWSRYKSSKEAYDKLLALRTAVHRKYAYETDNFFIYFSNALGSIEDMGRNVERMRMYKISIRFIYRAK